VTLSDVEASWQAGTASLWTTRYGADVRWERLFDDLQGQLDAAQAAEVAAEVGERTRIERSRITLADRLAAAQGATLAVHLRGGGQARGTLLEAAQEWLLLGSPLALVPLAAVTGLVGLGRSAATAGADGVRRRHSLAAVLRAVSRDRSPVRLDVVDAPPLTGTIDAVGADHLDLAEHAAGELRRPSAVTCVRVVPFAGIARVAPGAGTSSLG